MSKQAAAKTIAVLEQLGYVRRAADPHDRRRKRLQVTPRGREMTEIGAAMFNDVRERWSAEIGTEEIQHIEAQLRRLVGSRPLDADGLRGPGDDPDASA